MGSSLRPFILSIFATWALASCSPPPPAVSAALSKPFLDAVRLAIEDAALDGPASPDTLFLGESTTRASPAIANADTIVRHTGMLAVVGHSNSSASLAAAPIYNEAGVVQIAPTSTASRYAEAGSYSFRLVPPDHLQGAFLARSVADLLPAGARAAVFFVNDDYGRGLHAALLSALDTARFRVVFDAPHSDEEVVSPPPDRAARVAATIASVRAARPTVVLWLGRSITFEMYLAEIRRQLGSITILGSDAIGSWAGRDTSTGHWAGIRYVDFLDLEAPAIRAFRERYFQRFRAPAGSSEVLSYDAMGLVLAALRDGARTGAEVRAWLLSLGHARPAFEGLSGSIVFTEVGEVERSYHLTTIPGRQ